MAKKNDHLLIAKLARLGEKKHSIGNTDIWVLVFVLQ